MDNDEIEQLLREDAERFHAEMIGIDIEAFTRRVCARLGLDVPPPGVEPGAFRSGGGRSFR